MKFLGRKIYFGIIVIVIILVGLMGLVWWNFKANRVTNLTVAAPPTTLPAQVQVSEATLPTAPHAEEPVLEDIPLSVSLAQRLEIPWALDFLPDGSIVLTERPGRVRLIDV